MKDGTYCTETQAASIMEMSVEDFRRQIDRDCRAPAGFTMGVDGERHFVAQMVRNYRDALQHRGVLVR